MHWKGTVSILITSSAMLTLSACSGSGSGGSEDVPLRSAIPSPTTSQNEPGSVDADAPDEFTQTESGLKYRIRRKSSGMKPQAADSVVVHYRGWLDDGTQFDSSYERGEPFDFSLTGGVIPGWIEGTKLIGEGGMIELWIPSELGYGSGGTDSIPPNARLHFIIELISIV